MPDSLPDMADSIPLVRQIVRHLIGTVSVMPPEWCPPSLRNRVRHGPAYALRRHLRLRERLEAAGKIDHDHVFFLETGESFRNLHHPQVRWRKTLQSLKLRYRRPYTARQTSVSWNLMAGKNALWVAKQHGHSIATMLRAYAAWAEGATEVDVEAIKRSMNDEGPPVATNLAADLPVAEVIHALCMLTPVPVGISRPSNNPLPFKEKFQQLKLERSWLGWKDSNLRMAGSKRYMGQDNQQVAETTDRRVPSSPFDSPSLPPNLPPAIGETAVALGPARGTTNYLLLSANLRHPTGPCHVTPIRPQAHQRVARNDPKESRKVAPRLISRGRGAALGKLLSQSGGTQRMRPVLRTAFDPLLPVATVRFAANRQPKGGWS